MMKTHSLIHLHLHMICALCLTPKRMGTKLKNMFKIAAAINMSMDRVTEAKE